MGFIAPPNTALPAFQLVGAANFASPSSGAFGATTFAVVVNQLYLSPFPHGFQYTGLGVDVTVAGAAGTLARVGVFAANYTGGQNGAPGALLADLGTLPVDAIALQAALFPSPRYFRQPVWLGAVYNGTPTVSVQSTDSATSQQQTGQSSFATATGTGALRTPFVFGALPATLAGSAFTQVSQGNCGSPIPIIT